jgi:hypothetical protein
MVPRQLALVCQAGGTASDPRGVMLATHLDEAFDRLDDFVAVWPDGVRVEAVERLQESVGIDDDIRRLLTARLDRLQSGAPAAAVLLGLLLGLSASALAGEARP